MREHKYRGWHKESNTMLYDEKPGDVLRWKAEGQEIEVMQYTGLKDKNGKEIYEGDILDGSWINPMTNEMVKKLYEVSYDQGRYLAKLIGYHPYGTTMLYFENKIAEIIGNIHDNPELLEVKF